MRQLKVLELFSGTRSIGKAFERRGHEVYSVDWDRQFQANWYVDIEKVKASDVVKRFGYPDVVWMSPDCFTAGHLVWTSDGYKNIEDICCGDQVLTHKGRMRKVTGFYKKSDRNLYSVKISGCEAMTVTANHPFYARKKVRHWFSRNEARYVLQEPEWVNAENLTNEYRVGIPINRESVIPKWDGVVKYTANGSGITRQWIENKLGHLMDNPDFWWLVGRYFGDGHLNVSKQQIDICCGKRDVDARDVIQRLSSVGLKYFYRETDTTYMYSVASKELVEFLRQFGVGAANKSITPTILNLPKYLLLQFLDGYTSADGHWDFRGKVPVCSITTVSRNLVYGIQQAILKVFGCYGSVVTRKPNNDVILGRKVNVRKSYAISFRVTPERKFYTVEDSMAWVNVRDVRRMNSRNVPVYTMSVEEDESFTVFNVSVHNCSSYSVAAISKHRRKNSDTGALDPISDYARKCDRVNLNCMRLLRDLRPPLFFIENPRAGMRKMPWLQIVPINTITYCQYMTKLPLEQRRMKPTDLFTNHPNPDFIPPCKNGDPCHVKAPRGSTTGTQGMKVVDKYRIPDDLCEHIVEVSEDYIYRLDKANAYLVSQGLEPITPHWNQDYEPEPQQRLF